jgi:translation initiation factor IF-3
MHRRYRPWHYAEKVEALGAPRAGADPGRGCDGGLSGRDRRRVRGDLALVRALPFGYLHLFPFSPRPATPGWALHAERPVPAEAVAERMAALEEHHRTRQTFGKVLYPHQRQKIRAREIRVIDENGEQLGILAPFEALKIARERGLDLVEVSPNAVPPVCRIQDYGRFLYEKEKSERAAKKKQKVITVKEVKFSVTVDEHDYQTKKNQAVRFLTDGDKVKASLRFRGRQMAHRELGYAIINRLIQDIGEAGIVEFMPRMEGTILHAILAPSKKQGRRRRMLFRRRAPTRKMRRRTRSNPRRSLRAMRRRKMLRRIR